MEKKIARTNYEIFWDGENSTILRSHIEPDGVNVFATFGEAKEALLAFYGRVVLNFKNGKKIARSLTKKQVDHS